MNLITINKYKYDFKLLIFSHMILYWFYLILIITAVNIKVWVSYPFVVAIEHPFTFWNVIWTRGGGTFTCMFHSIISWNSRSIRDLIKSFTQEMCFIFISIIKSMISTENDALNLEELTIH